MRKIIFFPILGTLLVFFLLSLTHFTPFLSWIDQGVTSIGRVVITPIFNFKENSLNFFRGLSIKSNFQEERENLLSDVRRLQAEVARLQSLESENVLLRRELGFVEKGNYPYTIARVITKIREGERIILILNQGEAMGVRVGSPVISGEGVIVGKIIKVAPEHSFLQLITDNQSVIGAVASNQDSVKGLIKGEHNLSVKMDLIPADQVVAAGDLIVTSGIETEIPRGLLIGAIEQVITRPGDIFQSAYLKPAADLQNLRLVTIIKVNS